MATVRRSLRVEAQHPVLRGVFEDWHAKSGALSARPDAPVVPDEARRGWISWRWPSKPE